MRRYAESHKTIHRSSAIRGPVAARFPVSHSGWSVILALTALLLIIATGCSKSDGNGGGSSTNAAHAAQRGGKGHGRNARKPSQPPIPIAVETARTGTIASYYTATATLEAEKQARILARANGVIRSLQCEEGDFVREGQALLKIEDETYKLLLAQAEANKQKFQDQFDRMKGLSDQQLVSMEEFERVRNDLRAAEAAEELARLNLSYTTVRAPFTGRITSRIVDIGQNVNQATELFVIADFKPLLAVVHVPSKEFKLLKRDQAVTLILDSNETRLSGRIKLVSPVIDPTSGTIKVTIEIPEYPEGTRPGDFAEVSIVTERRYDRTLVPKISVFADRGDQIIYVAVVDSTAERRVVEVGFQDGESAEIMSGVENGERVIVKGQRSLKHGSPIKIIGDKKEVDVVPTSAAAETTRAGS